MKYRNKDTGVILEPRSKEVEEQLKKNESFEEYSGKAEEKPLSRMNKEELLEKAESLELEVSESATNAEIAEQIKNALAQ